MCSVVPGGLIPASLKAGMPSSSETVTVASGSASTVEVPVVSGTKIMWSFKVVAKDINFHAYFVPTSSLEPTAIKRGVSGKPPATPAEVASSGALLFPR